MHAYRAEHMRVAGRLPCRRCQQYTDTVRVRRQETQVSLDLCDVMRTTLRIASLFATVLPVCHPNTHCTTHMPGPPPGCFAGCESAPGGGCDETSPLVHKCMRFVTYGVTKPLPCRVIAEVLQHILQENLMLFPYVLLTEYPITGESVDVNAIAASRTTVAVMLSPTTAVMLIAPAMTDGATDVTSMSVVSMVAEYPVDTVGTTAVIAMSLAGIVAENPVLTTGTDAASVIVIVSPIVAE